MINEPRSTNGFQVDVYCSVGGGDDGNVPIEMWNEKASKQRHRIQVMAVIAMQMYQSV